MTIAVKDDIFLQPVTGAGLVAPVVSTRNTITQAEIIDGGTVVIAGLRQERFNNDERGIPWLSKVPVLGWLFKNDLTETERRELVIFLTAKVLSNPARRASPRRRCRSRPACWRPRARGRPPRGREGRRPVTDSEDGARPPPWRRCRSPTRSPRPAAPAPVDPDRRALMDGRALQRVALGLAVGLARARPRWRRPPAPRSTRSTFTVTPSRVEGELLRRGAALDLLPGRRQPVHVRGGLRPGPAGRARRGGDSAPSVPGGAAAHDDAARVPRGSWTSRPSAWTTRSPGSASRLGPTRRRSSAPSRRPASSRPTRTRGRRRSWPGGGTSTPWPSCRTRSRTPCSRSD